MSIEFSFINNKVWIFSYSSQVNITEIKKHKNITSFTVRRINNTDVYAVVRKTPNGYKIENLIDALKEEDIVKVKEIVDEMQDNLSQIIMFPDSKHCVVVCKDINSWDFIFDDKKSKIKPVSLLEKKVFEKLLLSNCINNILEISLYFDNIPNNMIILKGTNIEKSEKFLEYMNDQNYYMQVLSCTYRLGETKYLITINSQNQIDISKTMEFNEVVDYMKRLFYCLIDTNEEQYEKSES